MVVALRRSATADGAAVSDDLRNAISDAVNAEIVKLEGEVERLRARIAQLESRKREAAWPTTTGLTPPV